MTVQPHDCKTELRNLNLKVTPARLGVLEILEISQEPLDIASVSEYLDKQQIKVDPATIFRIINTFSDKGLVVPVQFNEGKLRYEISSKPHHHHFVCERCGAIQDISDFSIKAIEDDIQKKKNIKITSHSLEFFGICPNCQK